MKSADTELHVLRTLLWNGNTEKEAYLHIHGHFYGTEKLSCCGYIILHSIVYPHVHLPGIDFDFICFTILAEFDKTQNSEI